MENAYAKILRGNDYCINDGNGVGSSLVPAKKGDFGNEIRGDR